MTKHKSQVWNHFTRKVIKTNVYAECKFCKIQYYNNATRMLAHLKTCQPSVFGDVEPAENTASIASHVSLPSTSATSSSGPTDAPPGLSLSVLSKQPSSSNLEQAKNSVALVAVPSFVDRMTPKEQSSLEQSFARAVYATGSPFTMVENTHWINFFKQLRPAFHLPTRKKLSNSLLDDESERVSNDVRSLLQNSDDIALVTDGWTSINQTPIINFILTTPEPLFYKSVATGNYHCHFVIVSCCTQ
jgi:hypothetical protein